MATKIDELDSLLQSLQALKPPGASKGKITAITQLCLENVQSESVIAQKLYRHFKRTPATHKLGALFVVDSVVRQWIEKAKQSGQDLSGGSAPDGTYASGVQKITELMPALIDDLLKVAPQDQKAKVQNLVDIWERGHTFPPRVLADFKQKLTNPPPFVASSTPPGSPPANFITSLGLPSAQKAQPAQPGTNGQAPPSAAGAAPQQDASSILAALAGLSKPAQQTPQPAPPPPPPAPTNDLSSLLARMAQPPQQPPPAVSVPPPFSFPTAQPVLPAGYPPPVPTPSQPQFPGFNGGFPPMPAAPTPVAAQNPLAALTASIPPHILQDQAKLTQVLQIFQGLAQQGIPQEQWAPVIQALYPQPAAPTRGPLPGWPQQPTDTYIPTREADHNRNRDRSRSPDYRDRSANRRPSPVYGVYDASTAQSHIQDEPTDRRNRRQGSRGFRQRSPLRDNGRTASPLPPSTRPKYVEIDPTLPPGHIKVLSRTLFVGGANGSEADLRAIFSRFGTVQTCIVNHDKRHAFVKMICRADSLAAKAGMEGMRDPDVLNKARQTKWGVGFGPRECCDYSTGTSVIPIDTLTEADMKWILTAEYGGTGGRPVEGGMVVEEPDIEIGAGVSSKAMSRRVAPDSNSKRNNRGGDQRGRFRQPEPRYESPRPDPITIGPPPPVPGFGFNFPMPGQGAPGYQ